ncbi:hypothetical protein ACOSQ3_013766 [Xanthoceras sorbifolium]
MPRRWKRPSPGCYKINTDASTDYLNSRVGVGAIIHNDQGLVMATSSYRINSGLAVVNAEAMAILSGIQLAWEVGIHLIVVESDSKQVVNLLNGVGNSITDLGMIVNSILNHPSRSHIRSFSFSPRVSNTTAHALSRLALDLDEMVVWMEEVPDSLHHIVLADCHGSL